MSILSQTTGSAGALNAAVSAYAHRSDGGAIQVTGVFVGTLTFEGTVDGTNWFAIGVTPAAGGAVVTTATAVGNWFVPENVGSALAQLRVRMSVYTSGSATVIVAPSNGKLAAN